MTEHVRLGDIVSFLNERLEVSKFDEEESNGLKLIARLLPCVRPESNYGPSWFFSRLFGRFVEVISLHHVRRT